MFTVGLG